MVRPRTVEAQWMSRATDLVTDLRKAATMHGIADVSLATGISKRTLLDDLDRAEIVSDTIPRAALCRPAYRIDRTPLWSPEQLAEATRRAKAAKGASALPVISYDEADAQGLISVYDIRKLAGVHEQTVRKWLRGERLPKGVGARPFPAAVARRRCDPTREGHGHTHGPVNMHPGAAVRTWLELAGFEVAAPV